MPYGAAAAARAVLFLVVGADVLDETSGLKSLMRMRLLSSMETKRSVFEFEACEAVSGNVGPYLEKCGDLGSPQARIGKKAGATSPLFLERISMDDNAMHAWAANVRIPHPRHRDGFEPVVMANLFPE
jgi:hypothetical protein